MKISLQPAEGDSFVFSLPPEEVQVKYAAKCQSFDIISKGAVKVPKGREVAQISWKGEFFGSAKKGLAGVDAAAWKSPNSCVKTLRNWMNSGTELTLIISGTWINLDVTIASFEASPHGGYGDVSYSIAFDRMRELKIYTTKELKISKKKKAKARAKKKSVNVGRLSSVHRVCGKETLYDIATQERVTWMELYEKNREAIEAEAKKRGLGSSDFGRLLWPGTTLIIP